MSSYLTSVEEPSISASPAPQVSHQACFLLVVFALAASMAAHLIWGHSVSVETIKDASLATYSLPLSWKLLTVAAACSAVAAGILALVTTKMSTFGGLPVAAFVFIQIWMLGHSVAAYEDFSSWKDIFTDKGWMPMLTTGLVFVGALKGFQQVLRISAWVLAAVAASYSIYLMATFSGADRMAAMRTFIAPTQVLSVVSPFLLIASLNSSLTVKTLSYIPAVMFLLNAFLTATRSWSAMAVLFILATPFANVMLSVKKGMRPQWSRLMLHYILVLITLSIIGAVFSSNVSVGLELLTDRLTGDTRTGQFTEFTDSGGVSDLLLGAGPKGTWMWRGEEYAFLEGGLWTMAFTGGIPLVLAYGLLILWPGLRVLFGRGNLHSMASGGVVSYWALAILGLSVFSGPGCSVVHYFVCLCAGVSLRSLRERATAEASESIPAEYHPHPVVPAEVCGLAK